MESEPQNLSRRRLLVAGAAVLAIGVFAFVTTRPDLPDTRSIRSDAKSQQPEVAPTPVAISHAGGFVGSQACQKCHTQQHESWHRSYHRTMTQVATPTSVIAPFDNEELEFQGQPYRLEKSDGRFFVSLSPAAHTPGSAGSFGPVDRREVVMTTGSHHIQVYWVDDPNSELLIELPFYYHIAEQKWILREDTMLQPPGLRQTPSLWNNRCIKCHSVNGIPGMNLQTGQFSTHVAELGISCEACHGPGEQHVAAHRNAPDPGQFAQDDSTIVNPRKLTSRAATQVCGRCHSATEPHDPEQYITSGLAFRPGEDLHAFVKLNAFDPAQFDVQKRAREFVENYAIHGYWKDGTCRVGGDEYNALIESPCYQNGDLSCLSCHSMHHSDPDDQLAVQGKDNRACTQCHQEPRFNDQLAEHTHHPLDSSGSQCYNCHMPHTSYALLKGIRNHRITRPDVTDNVNTGKPNACNLCHLDQTLQWTAGHLENWFGTQPPHLDDQNSKVAASVLWLHKGNAALRVIVAWHMGWSAALEASGADWQAGLLSSLLDDTYSAVRFVAGQSLRALPGFQSFEYDFVASPQKRRQAVERALKTWRSGRSDPPPNRASVLLNEQGERREVEIEKLLRHRDNDPIVIAE